MPVRGPNDEIHIEMDLFYTLGSTGFICPEGIKIDVVLDHWVTDYERNLMKNIIQERLNDDAPLRHPKGNEDQICITSVKAADQHVREVEKDLY